MKKNFVIFRIVVLFAMVVISLNTIAAQDAIFSRGVNLTGWFQTSSAESIQFNKYTKKDFIDIQTLGCDVIRLPINMHAMTSGGPDYIINPLLFEYLDAVIDWTEELGLHLILDNHSFDPAINTYPTIGNILNPVWSQFAEHFKERSNLIYYEILNEPHGISDNLWAAIQLDVINTIREIDSNHTIVVGPANWNSFHNLKNMPDYTDTNLVYTFHFYDPFLFTHQGASWTDPSMSELENIPFPYSESDMPGFPSSLNGTWIQNSFNNYSYDGTIQRVKELIDIAVSFKDTRNVKIFCGEFGVYIPNSPEDDRVYWYEVVRSYLEEKGLAWTIWDYQGGFGLFEKGSNELFDYDLNIPLVNALGLNEVPQLEYTNKIDTLGFKIYTDYVEVGLVASNYVSSGSLNLMDNDDPKVGQYSISLQNVDQYNHLGFNFIQNRDFTYLVDAGFKLKFYLKGDDPSLKFDVRFIDNDNDIPVDRPWRIRYTIDQTIVSFDNSWHLVEIPLSDFTEHGAWENDRWYEPIGAFEWNDIDRLEFVDEYGSFFDATLWIDEIELIDPNLVNVTGNNIVDHFVLKQNYPNPFNPTTTIKYTIPKVNKIENSKDKSGTKKRLIPSGVEGWNVSLKTYDILGREIATLVNQNQKPGNYEVVFNAEEYSSGVYFYVLKAGNFIVTKKMILQK